MRYFAGLGCPEGYDLVSTSAGTVCAWRHQASCLAGFVNEAGHFVCTDLDFPCPPGMSTRRGSPPNWCYPIGPERTGAEVASAGEDLLRRIREAQARGEPVPPEAIAAAVQTFGKGILGVFEGMGLPKLQLPKVELPKVELPKFEMPKFEMPAIPPVSVQPGPGLDIEKASKEASRGMKAAAAILGVAVLGGAIIYVLGKGAR
jgi:hypothetical protein